MASKARARNRVRALFFGRAARPVQEEGVRDSNPRPPPLHLGTVEGESIRHSAARACGSPSASAHGSADRGRAVPCGLLPVIRSSRSW